MASNSTGSKGSKRRGRPPKLTPEQVEELEGLVRENPLLSLDDLVWALRRKTGVTISAATARKYLREAGFERRGPKKRAAAAGDDVQTRDWAYPESVDG